tara:strand:- start:84 stop:497 length:414 start_codon:yes stop_codon:yes gene_type:complete
MNKFKFRKVFSSFLALLLLISAFSFKVETRLCGAKLFDTVVASKVNSCCNSPVDKPYEGMKNNCCKSKVISVDGLNVVDVLSVSSVLPSVNVFKGFIKSDTSINFVDFQSSESVSYTNYTPPDLVYELQIEYLTLLI